MRLVAVEALEPGMVVLGLDARSGTVEAVEFDTQGRLVVRYRTPDGRLRQVYRDARDEVAVR